MAGRDEIIAFLDELLAAGDFDDLGPNGLQVPGSAEVDTVVTGVSSSLELIERAAAEGAQMAICHHGLLWDFLPRVIDEKAKGRLRALFDADMSLAGYHLPLDAHPEVGNNALAVEALGFDRAERFGSYRGSPIGWVGRSEEGVAWEDLLERCRRTFGQEPLAFDSGPRAVRSIGVITGAAASSLADAAAAGLDAFLTGEPAEHVMADSRESGVHFLACGHYATEVSGVTRLGEMLAERFGVEHRFIDIPNPV